MTPEDLPPHWRPVGKLAANLWQQQPWDADVFAALLIVGERQGVALTPPLVIDALTGWSGDGGDHAHYAPTPGDILGRCREIERANRPALPAPPPPDDDELHREVYERWEARQPAERVARLRALRDRLRMVPEGEEHARVRTELITAYLERRASPVGDRPGEPDQRLTDLARQAQEAPITAAQIAEVERMVAAGETHLVPARYRHLLPRLRSRRRVSKAS